MLELKVLLLKDGSTYTLCQVGAFSNSKVDSSALVTTEQFVERTMFNDRSSAQEPAVRLGLTQFVRSEHKFRVQSQAVKVLKRDGEALRQTLFDYIVSQLLSKGITSTQADI
jgi:hypothetical protein